MKTTQSNADIEQALLEDLAYEQDRGRAKDLRVTILVNERALPNLRGIPAMLAQKRIADAKADLDTVNLAIKLYESAKRREKRAAKRKAA